MTTLLLHPTTLRRRLDDEALVELVRAGDDRAFEAVVDRYRAPLVAFARQLLGGAHHDAEECVQDALIKALAGLRATDRDMVLKPWLYTIVRNRCLDELRRPTRTTDLALVEPVLGDGSGDPHARAVGRDELAALVASMGQLPARQRRALVMHELEGRSHADIARQLRVSTGATKALVCRARATLAEARAAA
jgi:RNA polymerase sigma-70 factor (ECF subfamily)